MEVLPEGKPKFGLLGIAQKNIELYAKAIKLLILKRLPILVM